MIKEGKESGGSVIGFAEDVITCWFDYLIRDVPFLFRESGWGDRSASLRASACALALQQVMCAFTRIAVPNDTLAVATVDRTGTAEPQANKGEVLVD